MANEFETRSCAFHCAAQYRCCPLPNNGSWLSALTECSNLFKLGSGMNSCTIVKLMSWKCVTREEQAT